MAVFHTKLIQLTIMFGFVICPSQYFYNYETSPSKQNGWMTLTKSFILSAFFTVII